MEDQESKFVCKWCDKRYPCGKSLGGHTRSHGNAIPAESEHKVEASMKKLLSLDDPRVDLAGQTSYGLRENPKKTFKAVDTTFPLPQERVCKQCGKGFQSLKALCGHMACHSERDRGLKDDHSWTSENQKLVMEDYEDDDDDDADEDSESDMEVEEEEEELEEGELDMKLRNRPKSNKRYKRIVIKSSSSMSFLNGSSSASEIDDQEQQEEVAICLMMLSRDSGSWGGVNSVVESSDNNSVVLETKSSSIDMRTGRKECLQFVHSRDNDETTPETKKLVESSGKLKSSGFGGSDHADEIVEPENSDSGYFLGEYMKLESDASVDGLNRNKPKAFLGDRFEETFADIGKGSNFNQMKGYKTEVRNNSSSFYLKLAEYESRRKGKISSENLRQRDSSDEQLSKNGYKRSKYECLNCKKTFNSYQALGGHRPCHKRTNAYLESRYETGENSFDGEDLLKDMVPSSSRKVGDSFSSRKANGKKISSYNADKKMKSSKNKKAHVCPFCHRVFKNGQALGGHKRSHFLGGGNGVVEVNNNPAPAYKSEFTELLDLNLPAPPEDEGDGQYMPW